MRGRDEHQPQQCACVCASVAQQQREVVVNNHTPSSVFKSIRLFGPFVFFSVLPLPHPLLRLQRLPVFGVICDDVNQHEV